jgi:hypothetical protein
LMREARKRSRRTAVVRRTRNFCESMRLVQQAADRGVVRTSNTLSPAVNSPGEQSRSGSVFDGLVCSTRRRERIANAPTGAFRDAALQIRAIPTSLLPMRTRPPADFIRQTTQAPSVRRASHAACTLSLKSPRAWVLSSPISRVNPYFLGRRPPLRSPAGSFFLFIPRPGECEAGEALLPPYAGPGLTFPSARHARVASPVTRWNY